MTKHCNILLMEEIKWIPHALWFIKQFNSHFWSARINCCKSIRSNKKYTFYIQNLVFWKPMVNILLYVKYSLSPGDKTISDTCCQLAQTEINLMNKYKFMNRWPTQKETVIWFGLRIRVGKNLPKFSFLRCVCPPNILLIAEYLHLNSVICTEAY